MKYDLHLHTKYSRCSVNQIKDIIKRVEKLKLDGIAITDHNTIKGALIMKKMRPKFDLIVGEEIKTDRGEILAYGINSEIKQGNILEVLDAIKEQGGVASLAHPFSQGVFRKKSSFDDIKKLDAVETFNGRAFTKDNDKAIDLASKFKVGQTAGSDGHFPGEIGRGLTMCGADVLKAIKKGNTTVAGDNKNALGWRMLSFPVMVMKKILPKQR